MDDIRRYTYGILIISLSICFVACLISIRLGEEWENLGELPEGYPPKPKEDHTIVIMNIPFVNRTDVPGHHFIPKPSWNEIKDSLPTIKEAGVDVIVIWGVYRHFVNVKVGKIEVQTGEGKVKLGPLKWALCGVDYLTPDPERGGLNEFLDMVRAAHELGIKVIGQLQISLSVPGGFVYEKHPEWLLQSIHGGPAVQWPWIIFRHGFVVNKAHPELIRFITEKVIPRWIEDWGLDGIYLDSPGMPYCDQYIEELIEENGAARGFECLTPVHGYYDPEPLVKAMRAKIDDLEKKHGRRLIFAGEMTVKTWRDVPEDLLLNCIKGRDPFAFHRDPRVNRSLGEYFDWVLDYNFRGLLKYVYDGTLYSYSKSYVEALKKEFELDGKVTELARFVNMWGDFYKYAELLEPRVAGCYLTLTVTSPGRILWISAYQLPPQTEVLAKKFNYNMDLIRNWYERLIKIKRAYLALQSDNIEDALLEPLLPKLIAYNRWYGNQSVTVIVNGRDEHVTLKVKTRFKGEMIEAIDLLSGEIICGEPENLSVTMPPFSARILVKHND